MIRSSFVVSVSALACAMSSTSFSQAGGGAANNPHLRLKQQYNWTFSEIGDVGNASTTVRNWHPPGGNREAGSVDYRYRVSTTEVTWGQYHEFLEAYAPVMPSDFRAGIVGRYIVNKDFANRPSPIQYLGSSGEVPRYQLDASRANEPATVSWLFFARMVNWLHNGKKPASGVVSADFEQGAYDTSTFERIAEGPLGVSYRTDQDSRSPGARFWIPSADELLKATYYDPNRYGEGQPGYWTYGNSSENPVPGDPAMGGETNAGYGEQWPDGHTRPLDVGSYADSQSPWGLLDTVGGAPEWTETWNTFIDESQQTRLRFDSIAFGLVELGRLTEPTGVDQIWEFDAPTLHFTTLRLAAAIPAPGASSLLALGGLLAARRRR